MHSVAPEDVDQAVATTTVQGAAGTIVLEGELTWQQKVLLTLEEPSYSTLAQVFSYFILVVICASIASFVLEAEPSLADWTGWYYMEIGSTLVFTIEYLLRFWVCNAFGAPTRLQFLRTPMNILDVVAVLPFYVELLSQSVEGLLGPLRVLRSVRLIRIFRIFRLSRYSMGMAVMIHSLGASVQPLAILVFFLIIGGTLFSSLLYYAEKMYCPDIANMSPAEFALHKEECIDHNFDSSGMRCCDEHGSAIGFASIMDATWWCAVTMTTVGYGDKVPATKLGQFIGGLTILSGIVLISLPVAIVGSRFQAAYEDAELEQQREVLEEKDLAAMAETKKSEGAESSGLPTTTWERSQSDDPGLNRSSSAKQMAGVRAVNTTKDISRKGTMAIRNRSLFRTSSVSGGRKMPRGKTRSRRSGTGWTSQDGETEVDSEEEQDAAIADKSEQLRQDLERLLRRSSLSSATREQVRLVVALLDHIGSTEEELRKLKEKDAANELRISQTFATLCRAYEATRHLDKSRSRQQVNTDTEVAVG